MAKETPLVEEETGVQYPNGDIYWYQGGKFEWPMERLKFQEDYNENCKRLYVEPAKLIFVRRTRRTTFTEPEVIE